MTHIEEILWYLGTKISMIENDSWLSNRWCITGLRNKVTITLGHYQHSSKIRPRAIARGQKELRSIVHCLCNYRDEYVARFFSFYERSVSIIKGVTLFFHGFFLIRDDLLLFSFISFTILFEVFLSMAKSN